MHVELADELCSVTPQCAARAIVLGDLKLNARECERPTKHAEIMRQCRDSSNTPSLATFSALLAKLDDFRNRREMLTLEN